MSRRKPEQGKINVVNLSNYTSPDITVNKTKDWVTYGNSNDYFKYLLDRYSGSPTNNAIINWTLLTAIKSQTNTHKQ